MDQNFHKTMVTRMIMRMVVQDKALYNGTRDSKIQNCQLRINPSAHPYILTVYNIKN